MLLYFLLLLILFLQLLLRLVHLLLLVVADPRDAACDSYLGPKTADDLQTPTETILSQASSTPTPDNGEGTIKMIVEDVDLDGYYDIVYASEYSEGARVTLARAASMP